MDFGKKKRANRSAKLTRGMSSGFLKNPLSHFRSEVNPQASPWTARSSTLPLISSDKTHLPGQFCRHLDVKLLRMLDCKMRKGAGTKHTRGSAIALYRGETIASCRYESTMDVYKGNTKIYHFLNFGC